MDRDTMGNVDRLLGKLEQFMQTAQAEFEKNAVDHRDIRLALEDLRAFKLRVLGGAAVVSALISLIAPAILSAVVKH